MIVTEEEAKTKRCQESFPAADGLSIGGFAEAVPLPPNAISYNATASHARQTAPLMCIGSACMAWRRAPYHMQYDAGVKQDPTNGYCGKAGRL